MRVWTRIGKVLLCVLFACMTCFPAGVARAEEAVVDEVEAGADITIEPEAPQASGSDGIEITETPAETGSSATSAEPVVLQTEAPALVIESKTTLTYEGNLKVGDVLSGSGTVWADNERVVPVGNNMFDLTFTSDDPNFPGQVCDGQCQDYGYPTPVEFGMNYTFTVNEVSGNQATGWLLCAQPAGVVDHYQRIGYTICVTFTETGTVNIHKADATTGLYAGQGTATLAGAEYTLTDTDTGAIWTLVTDASGYATLAGLPLGNYTLQEAKASNGYLVNDTVYTFTLAAGAEGPNVYDCYTTDSADLGRLLIQKTDASDGIGLLEAGFEVYRNDAGEWVKIGDVYRTDSEGKIEVDGLVWGDYMVVEVEAPDGYMPPAEHGDLDRQYVTISSSGIVTVPFDDYHYGSVDILKVDGRGGSALAGGEFQLYLKVNQQTEGASDSATSASVDASAAEGTPSTVADADGTWTAVGGTFTSDAEGRITVGDLLYGDYKVVEVKAPEGYMLPSEHGDPDVQYVTLSDMASTASVTFMDYPFGTVTIQKDDAADGSPIADTCFDLFLKQTDGSWSKVGDTLTTDADGKAALGNLRYGDYKVVEVRSNPNYLMGSDTDPGNPDADVEYFTLDDSTTDAIQIFHDDIAQVSCEVYKRTIAVTSAALDASDYGLESNVGTEEYVYAIGARNTSNCSADEFVVTDPLEMVREYGIRVTRLWTGTCPAGADLDGKMSILYQTNLCDTSAASGLTADNVLSASFDNPNNPDRKLLLSLEPGWLVWATDVSTTSSTELSVADLGLADGEYITALRFVYGDVDKGFFTGSYWSMSEGDRFYNSRYAGSTASDWRYAVVASRKLEPTMDGAETVIGNTVSSFIARNAGVLTDDASDGVETRVIPSIAYAPTQAANFTGMPKTGDGMSMPLVLISGTALASFSSFALALACRRRRRDGQR